MHLLTPDDLQSPCRPSFQGHERFRPPNPCGKLPLDWSTTWVRDDQALLPSGGISMTHQGRGVHDSAWQGLYDSSKSDRLFMTRQGRCRLCNAELCGNL